MVRCVAGGCGFRKGLPLDRKEIQKQFDATAAGYAGSVHHARGATLQDLLELAQVEAGDWILDVATGTAHTSLAMPPGAGVVIGTDLSLKMMREGERMAGERGIGHIRFVASDVHALPFANDSFERVVSRIAPHHFSDIRLSVREMARVLVPGGRLAIVDGSTPDDPEVDRFVDALERLHDPTHGRNYTAREWRGFCEGAGLEILEVRPALYDVMGGRSLAEWSARSHCSAQTVGRMRDMLLGAPPAIRDALQIKTAGPDVFFDVPKVGLAARKP